MSKFLGEDGPSYMGSGCTCVEVKVERGERWLREHNTTSVSELEMLGYIAAFHHSLGGCADAKKLAFCGRLEPRLVSLTWMFPATGLKGVVVGVVFFFSPVAALVLRVKNRSSELLWVRNIGENLKPTAKLYL